MHSNILHKNLRNELVKKWIIFNIEDKIKTQITKFQNEIKKY